MVEKDILEKKAFDCLNSGSFRCPVKTKEVVNCLRTSCEFYEAKSAEHYGKTYAVFPKMFGPKIESNVDLNNLRFA